MDCKYVKIPLIVYRWIVLVWDRPEVVLVPTTPCSLQHRSKWNGTFLFRYSIACNQTEGSCESVLGVEERREGVRTWIGNGKPVS